MTPFMLRALSDAAEAVNYRGLERHRGGWSSTHPRGAICSHAHATIRALVQHGYLAPWNKGAVVHITAGGEDALQRARERTAAKESNRATGKSRIATAGGALSD